MRCGCRLLSGCECLVGIFQTCWSISYLRVRVVVAYPVRSSHCNLVELCQIVIDLLSVVLVFLANEAVQRRGELVAKN